MKLYEIDQAIQSLLWQLEPDPETGEISMETDAIISELNSLQMERSRIMEYLAKLVLNTRAETASIKDEETRLRERRRALERKDERIMSILDRECAGVKTDCGVATVCYRKTEKVDVSNSSAAVTWLRENGHPDCYRVPEPEVNKPEVKKLLKTGSAIPGIELTQDYSCSLR